jgi:starch phosphorylase
MTLIREIKRKTDKDFEPNILTIGFARRAAGYKRMGLIFSDLERLIAICQDKVQFVFAGKAHPGDDNAKRVIQKIHKISDLLHKKIKVVYLDNYNISLGKILTSGVDIWLNNPQRPHEASGTSGMKAAINGNPNFSVLDGWWIEGHQEEKTGWAIGKEPTEIDLSANSEQDDANDFYNKLEKVVIPTYYNNRKKWLEIMKSCIKYNGSYFNTHRVVKEYCARAYLISVNSAQKAPKEKVTTA